MGSPMGIPGPTSLDTRKWKQGPTPRSPLGALITPPTARAPAGRSPWARCSWPSTWSRGSGAGWTPAGTCPPKYPAVVARGGEPGAHGRRILYRPRRGRILPRVTSSTPWRAAVRGLHQQRPLLPPYSTWSAKRAPPLGRFVSEELPSLGTCRRSTATAGTPYPGRAAKTWAVRMVPRILKGPP